MKRVLAMLVPFVLVAACSSSAQKPKDLNDNAGTGTFQGFGLTPPEPRPSFTLTDTAGAGFAFGPQTAGHATFLYFGYTNCPDVCPATMVDVRDALRTMPVAQQKLVDVVFVTTDVKHDTAAVLTTWLSNFSTGTSATWVGLRGTQAQVDAAQTAAHVTVAEDGGQTHSAVVKLYGTDDYARVEYPQSANEPQVMAHDLPLALAKRS